MLRRLGYLWALPATFIGLALAACANRIGARVVLREGVLEVSGPGVCTIATRLAPPGFRIRALTLGHVVLARDAATLAGTREHERAHVRQFERWGPAMIPAYLVAGLAAGTVGGDGYRDSRFERTASPAR